MKNGRWNPNTEPSPQYRPRQEERGCGILKEQTASTSEITPRQPHGNQDISQGVGSPLAAHPGNRMPMGTGDKVCEQTAFRDAMRQFYTDLTGRQSCSRKSEHTQASKVVVPTLTQSPAQKSFKLKSTVTVVESASQPTHRSSSRSRRAADTSAWCPSRGAPYHLIGV